MATHSNPGSAPFTLPSAWPRHWQRSGNVSAHFYLKFSIPVSCSWLLLAPTHTIHFALQSLRFFRILLYFTTILPCCYAASNQVAQDFAFAEPYFEAPELVKSPDPAISALLQDTQGWLWLGTSEGLVRHDGYRMRKFVHDDADPGSLAGNSIRALWQGRDGRLWVGTNSDGIAIFDPKTERFTHLRHDPARPDSLSGGTIHAMVGDSVGGVWVGTNEGLDYVSPVAGGPTLKVRHYRHDPANPASLLDNRIRSLLFDQQGNLWVGGFAGLQQRRVAQAGPAGIEAGFARVASDPANPDSLAGQEITRLFQAQDGKLWVGTQSQGAAWLSKSELAAIPNNPDPPLHWLHPDPQHSHQLSHGWVQTIAQVLAGQIWLGTFGGGINIVSANDGTVLQRLRHDPANASSLSNNNIRALLLDHSGILWVGTWGGGLQRHHPAQSAFRVLRYSNKAQSAGLSHPEVRSTLELANGQILLGTSGNGIDILDRRRGIVNGYRPQPGKPGELPDGNIRALLQTPDGTLWVGTQQAGVARLAPGSRVWQTFSSAQGLPGPFIKTFLQTRDGTLWAGTTSGIARWQAEIARFEAARQTDGSLIHDNISALVEDGQGRLWAAGNNALLVKAPGSAAWQVIRHQDAVAGSLISNDLWGLLIDRSDHLWVSTSRGLARLQNWDGRNAVFEHVSAKAGKAGAAIGENLWQDQQGRIWIDHGGQVLDPHTLRFAANDHPDLGIFWRAAHSQTRDGLLLYGGSQGMAIFDPAQFRPWTFQPPLRLTELKIDGKTVAPGALPLRLTPGQRGFSLEFAALDFFKPAKIRYRYRLEGYERDWINTDAAHRVASYGNLWPGRYTLYVQGSNSVGEWRTQALAIPVEILPAFWQTWWFAALVLLSLSASILGAHRWRNARLRAQARALQAMVEQRTSEAMAAHNEAVAAQHETLRVQNELALARQLEQTREQMLQQEKMAALGTLTAGVAHEINNPTHFTRVAAQIQRTELKAFEQFLLALLEGEPDPELIAAFKQRFASLQGNIATMLDGTERIQTIVKDLRAFSRREHEQKRTLPLSECLISTLNLVRTNWANQVEFITELFDDPPYECWPTLLNQVFMNLMVNGCHAIAEKRRASSSDNPPLGHLWLRLQQRERDGGHWLVAEIEDDGCGIEPAVRERILEPFFTTKDGDTGTGLGLSIAHGIIQKHGGTLSITSTPGQGSCFTLHLPLAPKEAA